MSSLPPADAETEPVRSRLNRAFQRYDDFMKELTSIKTDVDRLAAARRPQ